MVRIGITNIDWLVKENDVEMIVPGVGIVTDVDFGTFFVDGARAEFDKKSGRGTTTRTAVEPENKRSSGRCRARFKEPWKEMNPRARHNKCTSSLPEKQMLIFSYVKVS